LKAANKQLEEWDKELTQIHERNGDLGLEVQNLKEMLAKQGTNYHQEDKKNTPIVKSFPDAADLLNQLKARRKKSKTDLKDVEELLEILGGFDERV
jgi:regulator of replication initiation timing